MMLNCAAVLELGVPKSCLLILLWLSTQPGAASSRPLEEIGDAVGVNRATAFRATAELLERGAVTREDGLLRLAPRLHHPLYGKPHAELLSWLKVWEYRVNTVRRAEVALKEAQAALEVFEQVTATPAPEPPCAEEQGASFLLRFTLGDEE